MDSSDLERLVKEEEKSRATPNTPEDLLGIQKDNGNNLIHGLDLSVKSRAVYLYGEELELSIKEYIDMAYAMVRRAEGGIEVYLKEELDKIADRRNYDAISNYSVWVGGLASVRMSLRSMVESPMEPDIWRSYASAGQGCLDEGEEPKLHSLEKRLKDLKRLKKKKLISEDEFKYLGSRYSVYLRNGE
uniref:hypothetical protein n=1 Tax=Cyanobium sp. TaxID=2164130 RepID=UPI004047D9B3